MYLSYSAYLLYVWSLEVERIGRRNDKKDIDWQYENFEVKFLSFLCSEMA